VLTALAARIQQTIRNEDVFARCGGEEFGVICRSISEREAVQMAERIRRVVEELEFRHGGTRVPITISIGVASHPEVTVADATGLLAAADQALYRAKQAGRNRVIVCGV
jgi:diguanylate cyclase (GGDEF)-like protein